MVRWMWFISLAMGVVFLIYSVFDWFLVDGDGVLVLFSLAWLAAFLLPFVLDWLNDLRS